MKLAITGWRYHDGYRHNPFDKNAIAEYDADLVGWRGMVYANDEQKAGIDLKTWMEDHLRGEWDCDLKFNSGNPCYLVAIKDEADAMFFQLSLL